MQLQSSTINLCKFFLYWLICIFIGDHFRNDFPIAMGYLLSQLQVSEKCNEVI